MAVFHPVASLGNTAGRNMSPYKRRISFRSVWFHLFFFFIYSNLFIINVEDYSYAVAS